MKIYKYEVRNIIHNTTAEFWSAKGSFAEAWSGLNRDAAKDVRAALIKKMIMAQMCAKENCECGGRIVGRLVETDEVPDETKRPRGRPRMHADDPTYKINAVLRASTIEAAKKEKPADLSFSQYIDRLVRRGLGLS
jgi:hypothetical protein